MTTDPQRPPPNCMHARAIDEASDERGGRWATQSRPTINDTAAATPPPRISGQGPWAGADPVGPEMPINFAADAAMPDLMTVSGIPRAEALEIDGFAPDPTTDTEPTDAH
jgi:hypothetical protein